MSNFSEPRGYCLHPEHGDRPATHTVRATLNQQIGVTLQLCDECWERSQWKHAEQIRENRPTR